MFLTSQVYIRLYVSLGSVNLLDWLTELKEVLYLLDYQFTIKGYQSGRSWRRQWHPTPVLLPGKSHGWRSLEGCSPWGPWGSDTTERLHFHFSLSCIEGNGNPLQCSCLENPRDGGAWWAAISGVAQSRTRLKWLSSSSRKIQIEEIRMGNEWGKGPELPCSLWLDEPPQISTCSPNWRLSKPILLRFLQRLHHVGMISY